LPAGQGLHSVCPVSLLKLPGPQSSQIEAPVPDMRLPKGHWTQKDCPGKLWNSPEGQEAHESLWLREKEPAGHARQLAACVVGL